MKDIQFVQRHWKDDFFGPIAQYLDPVEAGRIRYELGKEVEWLIRTPNLQETIQLRMDKWDALLEAHEGSISQFDPDYIYRRQFFEYVLE